MKESGNAIGERSRPVLEVQQLDVAYGHAKVIHDLSMHIEKGEMVFIVGRNGAGKTTLLKTIAGLINPLDGAINFEGKTINGMPPDHLARAGFRFVAQDKKVFSALTVRSNVELAAHGAGEDLETAWQQVTRLYPKLGEFRNLPAGGLSGGQREILLIGRALIGRPKLLLIDEPTEGLAAIVIEDIVRILNEMRRRISAIIVEQNLRVVTQLADRIYVMKEGKIIRHIKEKLKDTAALERYL